LAAGARPSHLTRMNWNRYTRTPSHTRNIHYPILEPNEVHTTNERKQTITWDYQADEHLPNATMPTRHLHPVDLSYGDPRLELSAPRTARRPPPHPSLDHAGKKHLWLVNRFVPCSTTTKANKNRHHLAGLSVFLTSRAPVLLAKHIIRLLHFLFICVGGWVGAYTDTPYNIRIHLSN
jgi:hypothetical protein